MSSGSDTRVIFGCMLDLINAIAAIGSAVALFPIVNRQHEGVALGFVTARLFEAAIIVIGIVSLLAIVTLRHDLAGNAGTDRGSLIAIGRSLVDRERDQTRRARRRLVAPVTARRAKACSGPPARSVGTFGPGPSASVS